MASFSETTNTTQLSPSTSEVSPSTSQISPLSIMFSSYYEFAYLKIFVNKNDEELIALYDDAVKKHNDNMFKDRFPNSGFDIYVPNEFTFKGSDKFKSNLINMNIKCEMRLYSSKDRQFYDDLIKSAEKEGDIHIKYTSISSAFDLLPRSSICKTPLILANHIGLIDMGYRGWIMGAFRSLSENDYIVEKHTRLLQICHPTRCPIYVEVVPSEDNLTSTIRGDGGFGSTGKVGV